MIRNVVAAPERSPSTETGATSRSPSRTLHQAALDRFEQQSELATPGTALLGSTTRKRAKYLEGGVRCPLQQAS